MAGKPHSLTRIAAAVAAGLALLSLSSEAISANARVCRQLEAELASAGSGGRSQAQARKYDGSIARQRGELQSARKQARSAGCGFSLFGGGRAKCAGLNAKIEKMDRNLDALQRKRAELARGGSGRSRAKIMAAIEANGCRDSGAGDERIARREPDNNAGLFDRLFGGGIQRSDSLNALDYEEAPLDGGERVRRTLTPDGVLGPEFFADTGPKEFRTLCVRSCDGYFFPMSGASSRGDFARDQQNCESACPGSEVQVYYHKAEGAESASMVSAAGDLPYSELPTAYLYKQSGTPRPQSCGCNRPPQNFNVIAGNPPPEEAQSEPVIPVPMSRPDAGSDAETLANINGGLTIATVQRMAVAPVEKPVSAIPGGGPKRIRVVGPVFLPDPEAAIDLRAPARTQVR
jgi:hypothetical protein